MAVGMWLATGCSTSRPPPPEVPARTPPQVAVTAPPAREGEGQVTLDAPPGRARVELLTYREPLQLCITPCVVNLPLGTRRLMFRDIDNDSGRQSAAFIQVGTRPSIVRHAMGRRTRDVNGLAGGIILGVLGLSSTVAGIEALISGDTIGRGVGVIGTGMGLVLDLVAALLLGSAADPTVQPGATTQWTP